MRIIKSVALLILFSSIAYFIFQSVADKGDVNNLREESEIAADNLLKEIIWTSNVNSDSASAFHRFIFDPAIEYGLNIITSINDIPHSDAIGLVEVAFTLSNETDISENRIVLEILNSNDSIVHWEGIGMLPGHHDRELVRRHFSIEPGVLRNASVFKIYIWNRAQSSFEVNDVSVRYLKLTGQ